MRVIIAGGRDFNDYDKLDYECTQILLPPEDGVLEIVSGCAKGADNLGIRWAKETGIHTKLFPANWNLYGKSAGYRRNTEMANYAKEDNGVLIAFWDGKSKGTKHMIDLARRYGLKTFIINY